MGLYSALFESRFQEWQLQQTYWVSATGSGSGDALIGAGSDGVTADVRLQTAMPNTRDTARLIQVPRASARTCTAGDPGVAVGELFTDGSGTGSTRLQGPLMEGATGAWVSIDGPPEARQGHRRILHLRDPRRPVGGYGNPAEPPGPHRILLSRVLLALDCSTPALCLCGSVRTGDPYGQHTGVIRRGDRIAGDVGGQLERPPERPVTDLALASARPSPPSVRRGAHHE